LNFTQNLDFHRKTNTGFEQLQPLCTSAIYSVRIQGYEVELDHRERTWSWRFYYIYSSSRKSYPFWKLGKQPLSRWSS